MRQTAAGAFAPPTPAQLFPDAVARAQAPELEPQNPFKPVKYAMDSKAGAELPKESSFVALAAAKVMARINGQPILADEVLNAAAGGASMDLDDPTIA